MKTKLSFLAILFSLMLLAQTAPSYYNGIDFSKTKNELKADLATLITRTHTSQVSYTELSTFLKTTDADPEVSGNILLLYGSTASGTHQRSRSANGSWNREHTYPRSLGTPNLGSSGAGSDPHHLRPTDTQLNSNRGNLKFADGSGVTAHSTNGGWYPGDEWKGDVARMMMYLYLRYPTQCLPNNVALGPRTYATDMPDILLKWNIEDPVSDFERQRNNAVANRQGNRNPFIDNPYLATVIWGGDEAENTWPDTINGGTESDDTPPSTPTNVAVSNITASTATATWTASTDNISV
ncbi:MAG: endonuclease, partial [Cruoricaptor ignavus]|nr:endonuclease [Cruoricaptor ignavus]